MHVSEDRLKFLSLCDNPMADGQLQRCSDCKWRRRITLRRLQIKPDDELVMEVLESSDLVKKTSRTVILRKGLGKRAAVFTKHEHVLGMQRNVISKKSFFQQRQIVLHFDFAESWSINLPKRVQGFSSRKEPLPIFTCVVNCKNLRSYKWWSVRRQCTRTPSVEDDCSCSRRHTAVIW